MYTNNSLSFNVETAYEVAALLWNRSHLDSLMWVKQVLRGEAMALFESDPKTVGRMLKLLTNFVNSKSLEFLK